MLLAGAVLVGPAVGEVVAATVVKRVPATVVYTYGTNPKEDTNCSATVFAHFADVPGTISARANFTLEGQPKTTSEVPPFNDLYGFVTDVPLPAGSHRIVLSQGFTSGADGRDDPFCRAQVERFKTLIPPQATVDLTVEQPDPATVARLTSTATLRASRRADVARLTCPRAARVA